MGCLLERMSHFLMLPRHSAISDLDFTLFLQCACRLTIQSAVSYASEVCPTALRGYLTTYVNLCWVIGQFIAAGVLLGVQDRTDQWAYKIPFAIQWVWPLPLFILATFAPGEFL